MAVKKRPTGRQVAIKKAKAAQRPPRPKKGKTTSQRMAAKEKEIMGYADHIQNLEKKLKNTSDPDIKKAIQKIINTYHSMIDNVQVLF